MEDSGAHSLSVQGAGEVGPRGTHPYKAEAVLELVEASQRGHVLGRGHEHGVTVARQRFLGGAGPRVFCLGSLSHVDVGGQE